MASYIDSAPFPQSFSRAAHSWTISDHFMIFGMFVVSYLDLFFDEYVSQLSADTDMGQPGG